MEIIMRLWVMALLVPVLTLAGCPKPAGSAGGTKVSTAANGGVTAPASGAAPVSEVTETAQYTAAIHVCPFNVELRMGCAKSILSFMICSYGENLGTQLSFN